MASEHDLRELEPFVAEWRASLRQRAPDLLEVALNGARTESELRLARSAVAVVLVETLLTGLDRGDRPMT